MDRYQKYNQRKDKEDDGAIGAQSIENLSDNHLATGDGTYAYTAHFQEFEGWTSSRPAPAWMRAVTTPLIHQE